MHHQRISLLIVSFETIRRHPEYRSANAIWEWSVRQSLVLAILSWFERLHVLSVIRVVVVINIMKSSDVVQWAILEVEHDRT
jgi:hypothetical protein